MDRAEDAQVVQSGSTRWKGKFVWQPLVIVVAVHLLAFFSLIYFSWTNLIAFLLSHMLIGGLGTVIGLHRYFSHRSFACAPWFEVVLGFLATLSLQQGPITWAMYHRAHHRFSEGTGDPHSAARGFWWSHFEWLFYICPNGFRKNTVSVRDLTSSPYLRFFDKYHGPINLLVPIIFYLVTRDLGLTLWVFPLRIVAMWHCTWLVNSYVHSAKFSGGDIRPTKIRNSALVAVLVYGDGWHANHHEQPGIVRTGRSFYQFDPSYRVLQILNLLKIIRFNKRFR